MSDTQPHAHPTKAPAPKKSNVVLIGFILSFVIPFAALLALVQLGDASPTEDASGMEALARAQRLQKVGSVEIKIEDKNRPLATGEEVYKAQCAACHATGVSGAPKFGDAAEWGPRLGQGFEALVTSALKGKGAMSPQGGGKYTDFEISRAVAFLANAGGGKFPEPEAPAAEAAPAQ